MNDSAIKSRRDFPAVEKVASDGDVMAASKGLPRPYVIEIIRSTVDRLKSSLGTDFKEITYENLRNRVISELAAASAGRIGRVINGTGILVHTNLGRAPLSETLFDSIRNYINGYGNLEFDVASGKRSKRGELAEKYLAMVSGAESGTIVNNNAAALFVILNTIAARRKVLISRGELVQIGGGFRIPDIIRKSGAKLMEIGTTNITTLDDYSDALEENPALILKVHKSNFAVSGFVDDVDLKALVRLGEKHGIPVVNDLGSGVLIDTSEFAGAREPTVQGSVRDGADLTCFSGDKLLGGVQAGLIVGRKDFISRIKKNPIFRTVRVDKIVFSTMEELLGYYLDGAWEKHIKLWQLASIRESELYEKGKELLRKVGAGDKITLEGSQAEMGGGALPGVSLPSAALVFRGKQPAQKIAALFRSAQPPVIGRIFNDRFMIDLKAVDDADAEILVSVIKRLIDQI
jgi:L-seryl-tRNA(Ser) seleniumtransferase